MADTTTVIKKPTPGNSAPGSPTNGKGIKTMAADLDPSVVSAVANSNFKSLAEAGTIAMNLAIQDSVDAQRNMRTLTTAIVSRAAAQIIEPMEEAKAVTEIGTDNALAGQITQLLTALGSNSQAAKVVYATVPANEPAGK